VKIITDERCAAYRSPGHPERPERISKTLALLRKQRELNIEWVKPDSAPELALVRAHSPEHLARLKESADFDADTPNLPDILEHAQRSAGAALLAMNAGLKGESVFSLMRPPGHHATRTRAMGFCYLSNIAIAALEALASSVPSVAIFDFDVHHGNGTEAILLNRAGTNFFSIHQAPCYPGTGTRNAGNNCFNFPVAPLTARPEYRHVLESALEHMASLKPALIGVSAGFDCYARDPLAQETLEAEDFYWLGQQLRRLGIPLFNVLEGCYSDDLPELIFAYLKGIEGK